MVPTTTVFQWENEGLISRQEKRIHADSIGSMQLLQPVSVSSKTIVFSYEADNTVSLWSPGILHPFSCTRVYK